MVAKLDTLPIEVKTRILSLLKRWKVAHYSTIFQAWQPLVEKIIFSKSWLSGTDFPAFSRIMRRDRRRYMVFLCYEVQIQEVCYSAYRQSRMKATNKAFMKAMEHLFHLLKSWEDEGGEAFRCVPLNVCFGEVTNDPDHHLGRVGPYTRQWLSFPSCLNTRLIL